jgi:flagellar biosynthesis protein
MAKERQVAVALRYEHGEDPAPRVVAGGRGLVGEQILQIAFENGVKVREDAPLAEMLDAVQIGEVIPYPAFAAVAEILSYIYRVEREGR